MKLHKLPDLVGENGVFNDGDWVESKDQDPNGDVRLIQLADIGDGEYLDKSERFLTSQKALELKCTFLQPGDILVARMPDPLGRACIFPGDSKPCVTVVDVCIVRPDPNIADRRWLLHKINSPEFRHLINTFTTGTTRQRISRKNLGKLQFPLPPLGEQRRIAAVLDKADQLRQKRRAALAKLDTLLQATFLHMFGDPVTNPMGWEVETLEKILAEKPQNGAYFPKDFYTDDPNAGVEMVHMSDAFYETVERGNLRRVKASDEEIEKYFLEENDILIARRSLNYEGSAKPCRIPQSNEPLLFESSLIRITPNQNKVSTTYLYHYLANERVRRTHVFPNVTRSTISGINQAGLKRIKVLIPDKKAQEEFESLIQKNSQLKNKMLAEIEGLDNLFHSLQQRAFNGRL